MSYKVRNSIALGLLLLLIVGVGTYVRAFHLSANAAKIETEIKRIEVELSNTPNLINEYNQLSATVADTKKRWESRSKEIPAEDITGKTYEYFSALIEKSGGVKLNMIYQGPQQYGNYGYNVYNLRGEAQFLDLFKFIWYLENGRKLFKVNTVNTKGLEVAATEKKESDLLVTFEMTVHAFYATIPELAKPSGDNSLTPTYLFQDPFEPVITANLEPNKTNLVEIERSDLKAVVPGKAFVIDQSQQFRTLEIGDEVYLGFVTRLLPDEGKIECTLNKGGIIEKVELKIRYSYSGDKQIQQLGSIPQKGLQQ